MKYSHHYSVSFTEVNFFGFKKNIKHRLLLSCIKTYISYNAKYLHARYCPVMQVKMEEQVDIKFEI